VFAVTSTGFAQNCNNSCSGLSTQSSHTVVTSVSKVSAMMTARGLPLNQMSPYCHHQPVPSVSPTAVTRDNATVGRLPSPLLPCPRSPGSTVNSYVSSPLNHQQPLPQQQQPFVAAAVLSGTRSKQLPVYFMPHSHPNIIPQPFYRPGFTPKPGNFQPVGVVYGGAFHSNLNSSQQTPAGMFQANVPPQACILSAPSRVIRPSACQNSSSRTDVSSNPANSSAVTSAVQPGLVVNGASPLTLPSVGMSRSGMVLNDDEYSILEDAIKDEQAALNVSQIVSRPVETSSAESDSSMSDWSIIELPSQPTMSSVTAASQDETSLASLSLMQFSLDSGYTDASDSVGDGPLPGRVDQFQAEKLSAASVPQPGSDFVLVSFVYFDNRSGVFDCLFHSLQTLVDCSHLMCL